MCIVLCETRERSTKVVQSQSTLAIVYEQYLVKYKVTAKVSLQTFYKLPNNKYKKTFCIYKDYNDGQCGPGGSLGRGNPPEAPFSSKKGARPRITPHGSLGHSSTEVSAQK